MTTVQLPEEMDGLLDECERLYETWQNTPRWRPLQRRNAFWDWMGAVAELEQRNLQYINERNGT